MARVLCQFFPPRIRTRTQPIVYTIGIYMSSKIGKVDADEQHKTYHIKTCHIENLLVTGFII